jgi:hypothetical protein
MSHGVDATVYAVQLAFADADRDRFGSQAAIFELAPRDHAMLTSGDFRGRPIGRVEFCVHMAA